MKVVYLHRSKDVPKAYKKDLKKDVEAVFHEDADTKNYQKTTEVDSSARDSSDNKNNESESLEGRNNINRDEEDSHKHDEESIEVIMAKAKAFELEESFPDEEDSCKHDEESIEFLIDEDRAGTLCGYTVVRNSWIVFVIYRTAV